MQNRREFIGAAVAGAMGVAAMQAVTTRADEKPETDKKNSAKPGKEFVAILIYDGFTALDAFGPHHMFVQMNGADVHFVGRTTDPVTTDSGVKITPSLSFIDCPQDLTVLCVPGGSFGTLAAADDDEIRGFVADRGARADWVTSVCTGSLILGAAGLLKDYQATSHWLALDVLEAFGAIPVKKRVVVDRNRVTGGGVTAGLDFGLDLVGQLRGDEYAESVQLFSEYDPQPPYDAGSPDKAPEALVQRLEAMSGLFEARAKQIAKRVMSVDG